MSVTPETLASIADEIMDDIITIRRHLHQHPELSGEEATTAAFIAERCRQLGCDLRTGIGGHGILAGFPSNAAKTIILRADMDALPIQDGKQCDYTSQVNGVSHACGHDVHSSILLGALMVLKKINIELPYRVAAVFQPAEEITEGASAMIKDGLLDQMDLYRAYALHVYPYLPAGTIGLRAGPMCAAADMFEVEITGRGGHAARPHECIDVILIASQIIQALHHIISRKVDPMHPAVLTIGQIEGGHAANVIPDKVCFSGTVRSLDTASHEEIRSRMDHIIRQTAETWGATASFQMRHATPVLTNDKNAVEEIRHTLNHFSPEIPIVDIAEPSMGGEDFAEFLQHAPGCLMRLGTGSSPATRYPLHHGCFDVDEQAMRSGIITLASLCLTWK
ncbi:MAG TPA: amidohydrolase [Mariprofundaceae bacterium]|nr:amidohydrolase [Mariprofundaceae bacterium]